MRGTTGTHATGRRPFAVTAGAVTAGIAALLLATVHVAAADDDPGVAGGRWFSIGVLGGSTRLDNGLADYQWDVAPRMDWGAQALVGGGRFATGPRVWRTRTTQQIDPATAATVNTTSTELVGRGRVTTALGFDVMAVASAGLLHLGYQPDQVTITPSGGGGPIAVDLRAVNEWIGGAGLALRRPIRGPWALGLELDHRLYALDTAHRNGTVIEYGRQTFGDWSARLELAWISRRS